MYKICNSFYSDYFLEIETNCLINDNNKIKKHLKLYIFKIPLYPLYDPTGFYGPYNLKNKIFLPEFAIAICINGIPFISQEYNKLNKKNIIITISNKNKIKDDTKEDIQKEDTQKEDTQKEDTQKEDTQKEDTQKEDTQKEDTQKENKKEKDEEDEEDEEDDEDEENEEDKNIQQQPYENYYDRIPTDLSIWDINNLKKRYPELNEIVDLNIYFYICFCLKNNIHSPIIGFSFDGFPIYGPHGWKENTKEVILFKSSYNENYEFKENLGDLDICNGIYGPTPEFPNGIYHYKTTIKIKKNGFPVLKKNNIISYYPHIIARYKGNPEIRNFEK